MDIYGNIVGIDSLIIHLAANLPMLEAPLHAGTEHTNLTATVVFSVLSFVVGIGLGTLSDQFYETIRTLITDTAE